MELKAHFSNIHKVIIDHLRRAESEVVAAIAWFTDSDIFDVLCGKARSGIKVSVVLIGDQINQGPRGLNFQKLRNFGGQVTFLPPGSRDEPIMHHKFCVIDSSTVITGSYNWSHKARSNDENITIVTDSTDFASKYLDTFNNLLTRTGQNAPITVDADGARRRLEMIRNLILLGEAEDVPTHLRKLRPVAEALKVSQIVLSLDNGEYKAALEQIEAYLRQATSLVVAQDAEMPRLRFQLEILELRLESLSNEKVELERRLITFNRRHDDALGDVIQQILKARAELARLLAAAKKSVQKEDTEADAAARDAEETYQDYSQHHEKLQHEEPLPVLDEEAERELKSIYRKACSLCHPDKVAEEDKEAAHHIFVELKEAYKNNDQTRVREIFDILSTGGMPGTRSTVLSEVEALKAAIAELEFTIGRLVNELQVLYESDAVRFMNTAGATEAEWQHYFAQEYKALEMELVELVSAILDWQSEGLNSYE